MDPTEFGLLPAVANGAVVLLGQSRVARVARRLRFIERPEGTGLIAPGIQARTLLSKPVHPPNRAPGARMYKSAQSPTETPTDRQSTPLTAVERGPEWMAAYCCTAWCTMDHSSPGATAEWHQAAPAIIPPLKARHDDGNVEPFLTAHVTTSNGEPDVFGVHTELWIWSGGESYELDEEQTDQLIANIESFLPRLRGARALLAEARKGDCPRDPAAGSRAESESEPADGLREVEDAKAAPACCLPEPSPSAGWAGGGTPERPVQAVHSAK